MHLCFILNKIQCADVLYLCSHSDAHKSNKGIRGEIKGARGLGKGKGEKVGKGQGLGGKVKVEK